MTRMTLPRFLRAFKRIAHKGQWRMVGEKLRHRSSDGCPLVLLTVRLTGERFSNSAYPKAAAAIGMRSDAAHRVATAADCGLSSGGDGKSWRTRYLRRRMLAAVGLEE